MNYQDTVNWMFRQLPMYQNQGQAAYKEDLTNSLKLAKYLGFPERRFRSVHIAGTNGKGSTSHMIASILQEPGYKVGLYTSPHLKDFRERIKINGECISEEAVMQFIERHRAFFEANSLSFFEMTVGMAFSHFAGQHVDIAVIEVGLGGRLDSTNIITPELSVITNIGLDHTRFLGTTHEAIAFEKGGIIKPGIPVIIGETQIETEPVFRTLAEQRNASIIFADKESYNDYESDLKGIYQHHNRQTALAAVTWLSENGYQVSEQHIRKGLLHVVSNTGLRGRWEVLRKHPKIICDAGHNREGLMRVMDQLKSETYKELHMVIGMVNDKDIGHVIDLFPKQATYYYCKPDVLRGLDALELQAFFEAHGFTGTAYPGVADALKSAMIKAKRDDLIFVGGSTFVVAEIL